ncbi:MAG: cytochrome b/b6 domain-containing protein [Candidatus Protistobacter heckmanni]|nr:cytochrome b/b6 domain-containing protein [Candidatus Protistobacter heckmanni]
MSMSSPASPAVPDHAPVHPAAVRISHWINALAVLVMVMSGWKIYNASPIFPFLFPRDITFGGWLGGALLWHFAAMWLLVANALFYLVYNLATGRLRCTFFPLRPAELLHDLRDALRLRLAHTDLSRYNAVQKASYLSVMLALVLVFLSGLAIWKPVQFSLLRELMGDFDNARIMHFATMAWIVGFAAVHLLMVLLVPKTFGSMTLRLRRRAVKDNA